MWRVEDRAAANDQKHTCDATVRFTRNNRIALLKCFSNTSTMQGRKTKISHKLPYYLRSNMNVRKLPPQLSLDCKEASRHNMAQHATQHAQGKTPRIILTPTWPLKFSGFWWELSAPKYGKLCKFSSLLVSLLTVPTSYHTCMVQSLSAILSTPDFRVQSKLIATTHRTAG